MGEGPAARRDHGRSNARRPRSARPTHRLKPKPATSLGERVLTTIVHYQLDCRDWRRRVADELIDALLFDAIEAGVPIESLFDALRRRMGKDIRFHPPPMTTAQQSEKKSSYG